MASLPDGYPAAQMEAFHFLKTRPQLSVPDLQVLAIELLGARAMAWPEGERSPVGPFQHNLIDVLRGHEQPRHRPGIGPGPGLHAGFSGERAGPGPLQQVLREPGLRIDPRSFPDLP